MSRALAPEAASDPRTPAGGTGRGLLRTIRPKHWSKNVLVFAAPGAAGVLGHVAALERAGLAFVIFCALASGTYLLNDSIDADADRHHPVKKIRPIAAGVVPIRVALAGSAFLLLAAVGASIPLGWRMVVVSGAYIAVQLCYSTWFKHEPIFDIACVAAGFVLRAIAGGVAVRLPISQWFLIVAMFGAMIMATGKRLAEHRDLGDERGSHRKTLDAYSETFLWAVILISAAITTTAYCLWAFDKQAPLRSHGTGSFFELSIVPFVLGVLRYTYLVDRGGGARPEDMVFSDRALLGVGVVWLALIAIGLYAY